MPNSSVSDVYQFLDEWSGGDLRELAVRMYNAPQSHVKRMIYAWPRPRLINEPVRPGEIRPYVYQRGHRDMRLTSALRLLLYVPSIVLPSEVIRPFPFREVQRKDPDALPPSDLAFHIIWLDILRPLVADGSIRFASQTFMWFPRQSVYDAWSAMKETVGRLNTPDEEWQTLDDDGLRAVFEGAATPLSFTAAQDRWYQAILSGRTVDRRQSDIAKLARLDVPVFGADASDLLALRRSSETLGRFRQALGEALQTVSDIPESEAAVAEAEAIVADVLAERLAAVRREAHGTLGGRFAGSVSRRLIFAGVGAASGAGAAMALGSPALAAGAAMALGSPALAAGAAAISGATAAGVEAALEVGDGIVNKMAEKRASKAVWSIATSFRAADV